MKFLKLSLCLLLGLAVAQLPVGAEEAGAVQLTGSEPWSPGWHVDAGEVHIQLGDLQGQELHLFTTNGDPVFAGVCDEPWATLLVPHSGHDSDGAWLHGLLDGVQVEVSSNDHWDWGT